MPISEMENPQFDEIVQELLAEVTRLYTDGQQITDDHLLALYTVFGDPLLHALALLDSRNVTLLKSGSAKVMFEVIDHDGHLYSLFPSENFCLCEWFENKVIKDRNAFTCKHVLAVWLAQCIGTCSTRAVSNALIAVNVANAVMIRDSNT